MDRATDNRDQGKGLLLDHEDVRRCFEECARPAKMTSEVFILLVALAHLPPLPPDPGSSVSVSDDSWSYAHLRQAYDQLRQEDAQTRQDEAFDISLSKLFSLGIAQEMGGARQRYKVADSFRGLARAYRIMETQAGQPAAANEAAAAPGHGGEG